MKKFDEDKDGKLSETEKVKMVRARMAKSEKFKEMFTKRADKNTDGELTDDEIIAAMKNRPKRGDGKSGDRKRPGGKKPGGKKPAGDDTDA